VLCDGAALHARSVWRAHAGRRGSEWPSRSRGHRFRGDGDGHAYDRSPRRRSDARTR
jgi:hypothetical protein